MSKPHLLLAGLCAGGLLGGFATRKLVAPTTAAAPISQADPRKSRLSRDRSATADSPRAGRSRAGATRVEIPHQKSADTLESLLALKDDELYTRLAAWLTDAAEPDIAAFWASYGPRKGRSNDITDLVFLNWTRLDPQAAIAGSSSDQHAWWAWACHDPEGALAEATAHAPDHVGHVAWGIGEFHPEWLRAHYSELSQGAKDNALNGMSKWSDGQDPLAAIKFYQEIGRNVDKGTFKALVRQDPWSALDWVKEHPGTDGRGYSMGDPMQLIVDTMAAERPDDLERLAAQTPSGPLKVKLESALFASLLEADPEAALAKAKETNAPQIAAERLAALGLAAVKSDPEQAFKFASDLFDANPSALQMFAMIEFPGGGGGNGITIPGVRELFDGLMASDPARTLEMSIGKKGNAGNSPFGQLSGQWIERDFPAYTAWLNRQTDPAARQEGGQMVSNKLQQEGNYAESAEWIMSMSGEIQNQTYGIANLLENWRRNDPDAAAEWLDSSDFSAGRKAKIQKVLDQNGNNMNDVIFIDH